MAVSKKYLLRPEALQDVDRLWEHTLVAWSEKQADRYLEGLFRQIQLLSDFPKIAAELQEFRPPTRMYPYESHLIFYRIHKEAIVVVRILHNKQHWQSLLR